MSELHVVIMAGGSGTRFWPFSRSARPKHLLDLTGGGSLLRQTWDRSVAATPASNIWVVTTAEQAGAIREELPDLRSEQVLEEPIGRNTAPCIALACLHISARDAGAAVAVLPADHRIAPESVFADQVTRAAAWAQQSGQIVTVGIPPSFPATGYGYIETADLASESGEDRIHAVGRFVEKPDRETAQSYLDAGNFLWNAGMFVATVKTFLEEIDQHLPELAAGLRPLREAIGSDAYDETLQAVYPSLQRESVDYGVMEKCDRVAVIPARFEWDDLGSWGSLAKYLEEDAAGNRHRGPVVSVDASNNIVVSQDEHVIGLVGVENMIVVHTSDATLVIPRDRDQDVRAVVDALRDAGLEART